MSEHTTDRLMPELPEPFEVMELWGQNVDVYSAAQMREYARSYATALCQQGELLRQAREFIDTVHDGEYGYSECTRDELVEKIDTALSTSEGKTE